MHAGNSVEQKKKLPNGGKIYRQYVHLMHPLNTIAGAWCLAMKQGHLLN
jgi:hypothetical protein